MTPEAIKAAHAAYQNAAATFTLKGVRAAAEPSGNSGLILLARGGFWYKGLLARESAKGGRRCSPEANR